MPPRTKHRQRRNSRRNNRAKRAKTVCHTKANEKNWHFQDNGAVCYAHNRSVCGTCCIDFSAFNMIYHTPTQSSMELCAAMCDRYFKSPVPVSRKFKKERAQQSHKLGPLLSLRLEQGLESMSAHDATSLAGYISWTLRYKAHCEKNNKQYMQITRVLHWTVSKHSENDAVKQLLIAVENQRVLNQQQKIIKTKSKFNDILTAGKTIAILLDIEPYISKLLKLKDQNNLSEEVILWIDLREFCSLLSELRASDLSMVCVYNSLTSLAIKYSTSKVLMPDSVHKWSVKQMDDFLISNNIGIPVNSSILNSTDSVKIELISAYIGLQNKFLLYKRRLSDLAFHTAEAIVNGKSIEKTKQSICHKQAKVCSTCKKEGKKKCGGCLDVYYCSRKCQKRDWMEHKQQCATALFFKYMKKYIC